MDRQEQVLIGRRAKDIGHGPKLERPKGRRPEQVRQDELEADDADNNVLGQRFRTAQLRDLAQEGEPQASARKTHTVYFGRAQSMRVTSGWALMMASRRVRCGSSVYVQKKSCFDLLSKCVEAVAAAFLLLAVLVTVAEPLDGIVSLLLFLLLLFISVPNGVPPQFENGGLPADCPSGRIVVRACADAEETVAAVTTATSSNHRCNSCVCVCVRVCIAASSSDFRCRRKKDGFWLLHKMEGG